MTSRHVRSAIFSRARGSGALQLDLLDGLTIAPSGPPPVPASRSRRQAACAEPMIQGICGRTYIGSSVPPGTQDSAFLFSWESRLRERLAMVGSTESALIWREKVSPQGQSISRLALSTRHTNATDCSGVLWPTPKASAAGETSRSGDRKDEPLVGALMRMAQWPTPRASDGEKGGPNMQWSAGGQPLPAQMHALWVTPSARDWKDSVGMATTGADDRTRIDQLPRQMVAVDATAASGQTPNGSPVTTAKRGAPNPAFACWLMGWSDELVSGALQAIQSFRSSRRKSSPRSLMST